MKHRVLQLLAHILSLKTVSYSHQVNTNFKNAVLLCVSLTDRMFYLPVLPLTTFGFSQILNAFNIN